MLEPNSRMLLRDVLRPPTGYVLDRAISTTFSLDLMALLTLPVSFTFFQLKDQDGPPQVDPLALLESLRRYAGKITVFCQAGQIHVPARVQLLLGYLENSIYEVQAPRGGVFHPKLTVLRYKAQDDNATEEKLPKIVYRLLCSSRNLTFDRSWDTILTIDDTLVQHRTNAFARNHPLARFVRELPGLSVHPLAENLVADVRTIADELLRVDFQLPEGFTDMNFYPLGLEWTELWPILNHRRTLAMAPFVDDGFIKRYQTLNIPLGLISRADSLDELSVESLRHLFDAWYLNTAADPIPVDCEADQSANGLDDDLSARTGDRVELATAVQLHGLHAKLFVSDNGWNSHVWTGSANATTAAFERNVEFMICLVGKRSHCGIATFVNVTDENGKATAGGKTNGHNDGKLGFSDLLLSYHRDDPSVVDGTRKALERTLDTVRYALAGAKITAHIEPLVNSSQPEVGATQFRVTLMRPSQEQMKISAEVKIECYPLTLNATNSLTVASPIGSTVVVFEALSFEALTSFYAFRLSATKDELSLSSGFVLNLPLVGAPADRTGRLLLALLGNREQLLKYILMLIADDEESARRVVENFNVDGQNHHADGHDGGFGLPLLEPLLQSLERQPARLDQISRLIEDLRMSPEGRGLISEQFLSIWEPIWAARKRIGKWLK
jgi:hypothetical protein